MANIGFRYPWIAKYAKSTGTYSDGFQCSHGVQINVTPNYSEASLYGDDTQVEYEKSLTDATVSLGVTALPLEAASVMFGHTVNTESKQVSYKATDEANYVGLGFISVETNDGVKSYDANIITCAKFTEGASQSQTKGDSLTFNTPTVEGKAIPDASGVWKEVKSFASEAEALEYIKTKLNITSDETSGE